MTAPTNVAISALYVYPVKACRGIAVTAARVVERGFEHDRRYMIVDASGRFLTQRELPELSQVRTSIDPSGILLHRQGYSDCLLPFAIDEGPALEVQVWSHTGRAIAHPAASTWISAVLGRRASIVYMPESHRRPVNPERARPGDVVSFADAYPFLVVSEESLADLNFRLKTPIAMERFRPNIVVRGIAPYAEDTWQRVRLGELEFRAVKRCDRCSVTTVDPDTGVREKEPLRTLAEYRQQEGKVWFGMNLIHDRHGWLGVGDHVTPLH
jgi:uncharacterized protein YcbX